jgi:hypothetical protein
MPEYYHFDIARWEGEGGASDATVAFSKATRLRAGDWKRRRVVLLRILAGLAVLVVSVAYARRKEWV